MKKILEEGDAKNSRPVQNDRKNSKKLLQKLLQQIPLKLKSLVSYCLTRL
jgi:hypothetical protein